MTAPIRKVRGGCGLCAVFWSLVALSAAYIAFGAWLLNAQ